MFRKLISIIFLLFLLSGFARADLESAKAAYEAGDYDTALELLIPLAEVGDAKAQSNLGFMYHHGYDLQKDNVNAYAWIGIATANGHTDAIQLRYFLETQLTLNELEEARELARELWEKYGNKNNN